MVSETEADLLVLIDLSLGFFFWYRCTSFGLNLQDYSVEFRDPGDPDRAREFPGADEEITGG